VRVTELLGLDVDTVVLDAVMVMLVVWLLPLLPPPPLPGAEAMQPASGSRLKNRIARDQA
jgi:hypothetical protein